MLKQFVIALFLTFFSLTSVTALAEAAHANIKKRAVSIAFMQGSNKYTNSSNNDTDNIEIVADLNTIKTRGAAVKPEANNSEKSGWLLAFALIGFVMLSNRRGV